jgi:tRNA dimethylallyltransferase
MAAFTARPLPVILLMGPTASGKTDLALQLALRLPVEIISVDSAQVYRHMDIGTAKPSQQIRQRFIHHLVDIRDPAEPYSAAEFKADAQALIRQIQARGKIPLLVGGTTLYFRTLTQGLSSLPAADVQIRAELTQEAAHLGWPALHARLAQVDPAAAQRIHPHDRQRIQRALEIWLLTRQTQTELWQRPGTGRDHRFVQIALQVERALLHERIAHRFHAMLAQGLIDEVAQLYARGDLDREMPAMRAAGYRQVWDYLDGLTDRQRVEELGIIATRQLAKRQLTAMRAEPNLLWFDSLQTGLAQRVMRALFDAQIILK